MSFVTSQQLHNLRCLKCRKYLSHFPIHQNFDQQGCICGRCSNDNNVQRNTVYEKIALLQKFPCSFDGNGCLETLYPDQVPFHEKFCKFRTHDCPTSSSTNCNWKGSIRDMWDHFKKQHLVYIIKDNKFEVDFEGNYNENYLLKVDEELYIINQSSSKKKTFSCNVFYIGSNTNSSNYIYKLTFRDVSNKNSNYVISKKLEDETILDRTLILEVLRNPSIVVADIQVSKPEDSSEDQFEEVQWELLRELECSCCFEYMLPPVLQCATGHSICSNCKPTQSVCPTCKMDFKDTVNITLGNLIEHLVCPCKNEECKFTCKAKDIRQHQSNCTFGKFKCPLHDYENCDEEMSYIKLYDHVMSNHSENFLEMDTISIPFTRYYEGDEDNENVKEDCFILKYDFQLFKMHYNYENGTFRWEMQLIGSSIGEEKYDFEIDAADSASKQRISFRMECSPLSDKTEAFGEGRSFISINLKQIGFMVFDELTYSVRILPNENN